MEEEGRTEISLPFVFSPPANVEKDDSKSKRKKKHYANKNNTKAVEIEDAGEEEEEKEEGEEKKRKNRKTKEENPVMNAGCSRFNESPRWSSTGNKESIEAKDLGSAEVLAK